MGSEIAYWIDIDSNNIIIYYLIIYLMMGEQMCICNSNKCFVYVKLTINTLCDFISKKLWN